MGKNMSYSISYKYLGKLPIFVYLRDSNGKIRGTYRIDYTLTDLHIEGEKIKQNRGQDIEIQWG